MKKKLRSTFLLENLEARLLFSADLAPLPVDGGGSKPEVESGLEISLRPDGGGLQEADTDRQERQEVIFVDEAVDDFDQLIADLESQLEKGRQFDIVALDSDDDGIAQISAYLNQHQDVAAVHFISHGADGEVVLGNSRLNATTLDGYAEAIEGWQRSLSKDADLLFYGCNFAAGDDGQDLINSLTLLSGADVAASNDVTGSVKFGGDWELEYGKGEIETAVAVNSETQQNWNGVLATFIVNTTADTEDDTPGDGIAEDASGNTSLRAAIMEANALGGANEIILGAGNYVLSLGPAGDDNAQNGDLDVTGELTITGAGAATTVIDANSLDRVFHLKGNAANLTLTDLTVRGGSINGKGGGIFVDDASAQLTASRVIVTGNIADDGAGIFNRGTMTLTDVVISNNGDAGTFEGGGIHNKEVAILNGVTLSGNRADDGGGIHNDNTATSLSLTNVTVSGNTAADRGGGLYTQKPVTIVNATFTLNNASNGGGIFNNGGTVNIKNTIVAENLASLDPDVEGSFISQGYNLIGDKGTVTDFTAAGDQAGTAGSPIDPMLGSLWDNGGFTETHALLAGSPAIDPAGLTGAPPPDQRGFARDVTPDIGAFEYNGTNTAPTLTVTGAATVKEGTVYTLNLSASDPDGDTIIRWTINWGDGTIETIPGNPSAVTHTYTQAGFTYNITVSATDVTGTYIAGDLISTSVQTHSLMRFDATTGNFLQEFGKNDVSSPIDVQIGPDGGIYVTGFNSHNVFRYDADGSSGSEFVGAGDGGLWGASRMAFGPDGNLYVTSMHTDEVLRYDGVTGNFIDVFADSVLNPLDEPDGITFGPDGDLYVASRGTGEILRFDGTTGNYDGVFATHGFMGYMDIHFGPDGNLWVTNQTSDDIRRYDGADGTYLGVFSSTGASDFAGIAFGPDNRVYMSDAMTVNDKIIRYPIGDGSSPEDFILKGPEGLDQPVNIVFTPAHQVMVVANNAGTVTIDNTTPANGDTLTASVSDPDGASGAIAYQWKRDGADIVAATGASYTTVQADVGAVITVTADYTDDLLNVESLTSAGTATVTDVQIILSGTTVAEMAANGTSVGSAAVLDDLSTGGDFLGSGTPPSYTTYSSGQTFSSWAVTSGQVDLLGGSYDASPQGGNSVDLGGGVGGGGQPGTISQTLTTVAGQQYEVTFALSGMWVFGAETMDLRISFGSLSQDISIDMPVGWSQTDFKWTQQTLNFTASSSSTDLSFASLETDGEGPIVGDIAVIGPSAASYTYTLIDDAGGRFDIHPTTGEVTVADGSLLDYETATSHDITVRASLGANVIGDEIFTIQVTDINDAPTATNLISTSGYTEGAASVAITDIVVGDVDTGEIITATLTLVNTTTGSLSANDGATYDGGTGEWTITDTVANVNLALVNLVFTPNTDNDVDTTIDVVIDDGDEDASGPLTGTITLDVTPVDDPPTVVTNAPLNVPEEATRTITAAYLETTDPDNSPDQIIYTLTTLPSGGWVRLSGTPLNLGQTFTQDDINNNRVTYRDDDDGETTSFQMTVSDGNTILPAFSFSINGQPINDAPVVSAPGSALNATEQIGLAIHGTGFGVSDLDEAGAGALATLTVGEGTISVVVGNSGASVDSGDGTGTVTLSGSIAQLNALLTGTSTGTITYLNNSDTPSSNTTLTVTVNDQGNTGSDPGLTGDGSSEEGNNTVTINIASVNDAPTINSPAGYGVDEDDNYRALAGISIVDADAGGADVQVTLGVTNGVLLIGSTAGLTSISGNDSASVVLVGSVVDINGALASLSFKPNPDFAGSDNLSISVDDLGNTGDDGPKVTNKIVPMIVNPLNDPPVLGNNSLTITEGATVIFDSSMLSATDVDNPDGGLTFNISAVMGGQFERVSTGLVMTVFTQADITSGDVRFVHDGSQTAPSYNVSVTDGSANVGPTPAVINFTNINDPGTVTIDNTTPAQGDMLTASVSDPDGASGAIAYQWFRDGVAIGGATAATYTTTQADVGKVITVTADYTDDLLTVESLTSAGTAAVTNVNDPGTVTIDNTTPAQGDTLTASVSDVDGATGAISYQWYRGAAAIGGATGNTYTTVQADVGAIITVTAIYTDDLSSAESLTSAGTAAVANVNDPGTVTIDNTTPAQGDTLTASVSDPDGASGAISYQWFSDGVAIGGATSTTYTTVQADVGSAITVTATYTDDLGSAESPTSAATAAVTNVNDTGTVSIDNLTPAQGDTLTASVSDPDGASGAISYQWYRGAVAIGGATSVTYTTVQADVGSAITVTATYTDDLGAGESPTSAATAAVTNVNDPGTVTIDNLTPAQGDTLTANVIDPDGASGAISYQWFSDGAAIGGATGKTYTTVQADVGTIITVTADYTDDQSTVESLTSAGTAAVTNVNDNPVAVNDNLNATEDNSMTITSVTDLLANDSDIDGDALTLSGFSQPANGMLVDNADGTLGYTPAGDFCGIDSFTYTISDGNSGTADGTAIIVVAPVGDTPQVTNVSTSAEVQSGLIFIDRHASDGAEVSHFKLSGITNGSLHLADGLTRIDNGDYVTVAQGQAGLRFTPAEDSTADGSFNVESSEDGVSVASQSGIATSIITVLTTAPPPAASEPSPPLAEPEPVTDEEVVEEEAEASEDVADETDVSADADNMFSVKTPQSTQVPGTAKPSLGIGASFLRGADFNGNDDKTPDRSTLLSPQTLKMLFEAQNLGELKTALGKLDITTLPPDVYELVRGSLDAVKEEMGRDILLGKTVLGSAIATSVGLSAGYVVWMLKGGSLLASVLSSLPAWQLADPLAILVGKKDDENEDDESLETIIEEGSGRDKDKKRKAAELDNLRKESVKR